MIPVSKIAYGVLKVGFKPLFWRYESLPRVKYHPCPDLVKNGVQTPSNAAYTVLTPLLYLGLPKYKA